MDRLKEGGRHFRGHGRRIRKLRNCTILEDFACNSIVAQSDLLGDMHCLVVCCPKGRNMQLSKIKIQNCRLLIDAEL